MTQIFVPTQNTKDVDLSGYVKNTELNEDLDNFQDDVDNLTNTELPKYLTKGEYNSDKYTGFPFVDGLYFAFIPT